MKRIALLSLVLGLVFAATAQARPTTAFHSAAEARTVVLINQIRVAHGLHTLRVDPHLAGAAREHSANMLELGYFEHDGPDGAFAPRVRHFAPGRGLIGENIYWGSGSLSKASSIVSGWMHSAPHRHIILMPALRRLGLGVAYGTYQGTPGVGMATADFSS